MYLDPIMTTTSNLYIKFTLNVGPSHHAASTRHRRSCLCLGAHGPHHSIHVPLQEHEGQADG